MGNNLCGSSCSCPTSKPTVVGVSAKQSPGFVDPVFDVGLDATPRPGGVVLVHPSKSRRISLQDLLDVFDDFRDKAALLRFSLNGNSTAEEAASSIVNEVYPTTAKAAEHLAIILQNLKVTSSLLTQWQEGALQQMTARIEQWRFDTTGRVDVAPKLQDEELKDVMLNLFDMTVIRQLAFAQRPCELHNYATVFGLSEKLYGSKEPSDSPHAIITVGAPGAGKDFMCMESQYSCTRYLAKLNGVPYDQWVEINPDFWVENLCKNNNEHRDLGNFINLEHLFYSIQGKYNIIFNGTGKNVRNTLGRVVSRLKEANYKIYFCIVLARFDTVLDRIAERKRRIGRDVPEGVVRAMFKDLDEAIPLYLKSQEKIANTIFVYDNSGGELRQEPKFTLSSGKDPKEALEFARATLSVPPEKKVNM